MGARFALVTLESFPIFIEDIYLLAPDGLIKDKWYRLATTSNLFRGLFRYFMKSPKLLLALTSLLGSVGTLNKGLIKFVQIHLKHKSERMKVYYTWTLFRNLSVQPEIFLQILESHNIKANLVLGEFDRVINAQKFKKELKESKNLKFKIVPLTHNKLFHYNFS